MLAGAATAGAATLTVAPGASRKAAPCEVATPCEFAWALEHATSGENVQFESGEYDFSGASNDDIVVHEKVKLEPASGDTTRPLIKQTIAFPGCNCAMIGLETGDVVDGLAIDQAAADEGHDGGALELNQSDVVERSIFERRIYRPVLRRAHQRLQPEVYAGHARDRPVRQCHPRGREVGSRSTSTT